MQQGPDLANSEWNTIPEMFAAVLVRFADNEALVDGTQRLRYRELGEQVFRAANAMQKQGLRPGDRVAFWGANSYRWEVAALACWWSGGVVVPVSNRWKSLELLPLLKKVKPRALFAGCGPLGEDLYGELCEQISADGQQVEDYLPACRQLVSLDDRVCAPLMSSWNTFMSTAEDGTASSPAATRPGDICEILYTSGTSGQPKGVLLDHSQVLRMMACMYAFLENRPGERLLLIPPLAHSYGLNAGLLASLMSGMTQVIVGTFRPDKAVDIIRREGITTMTGAPAMLSQLLREAADHPDLFAKLRSVSMGGAFTAPELIEELRAAGVPNIASGYGLTECNAVAGTRLDDPAEVIANTVGKPQPGVKIKLIKEQGDEAATGDVGEIFVSGYGVMHGYLDDARLTAETIDAQGWLRTGDLGRFRSDGNLQIVGRKKEMYISFGLNVYPTEVEYQLMSSGMLSAVAVVSRKNKFSGEEGVAFVVAAERDSFQLRELIAWARKNMATYKVPARFILAENLPLNPNGKIDKLALAAELR